MRDPKSSDIWRTTRGRATEERCGRDTKHGCAAAGLLERDVGAKACAGVRKKAANGKSAVPIIIIGFSDSGCDRN